MVMIQVFFIINKTGGIYEGHCEDDNGVKCNISTHLSLDFSILNVEMNYRYIRRDLFSCYCSPINRYLYLVEDVRENKFINKNLLTKDKVFLQEGRLVYHLGNLNIDELRRFFKL